MARTTWGCVCSMTTRTVPGDQPGQDLWHCLGACNEGGDVIQWVMKRQGVNFRHAVELLREGEATAVSRGSQELLNNERSPSI